jgi:PilZ domain
MLVSQANVSTSATGAAAAPEAQSGSHEHRWARRQNCRIAGEISHNTMQQALSCVIRDTSSSGARVELTGQRGAFAAGTERVPDHITLVMPMDRMQVECRVAWRKGHMMGLRYLSPARPLPKRVPTRIGPQKQENKSLLGRLFK